MKTLAAVLILPFTAYAALENNGRGAKAVAFSNAFVAVADNSWAVGYNPAGLAQLRAWQASAFFVPQQFGLPELRTMAASASVHIQPGTVGVVVDRFGFDLYNTTSLALGYGFYLAPTLAIGAAVNFERIAIERYGSAINTTCDIGLLGWPTPELSLGFSLKNLTAATIGDQHERLPQYAFCGFSYTPSRDFLLTVEFEKDPRFPWCIKGGIEKTFWSLLSFRCGVGNNPAKFSAGLAVSFARIEFGYAGYSHSDLGWTHQIEIAIR